jgi:hypothetical protein
MFALLLLRLHRPRNPIVGVGDSLPLGTASPLGKVHRYLSPTK